MIKAYLISFIHSFKTPNWNSLRNDRWADWSSCLRCWFPGQSYWRKTEGGNTFNSRKRYFCFDANETVWQICYLLLVFDRANKRWSIDLLEQFTEYNCYCQIGSNGPWRNEISSTKKPPILSEYCHPLAPTQNCWNSCTTRKRSVHQTLFLARLRRALRKKGLATRDYFSSIS